MEIVDMMAFITACVLLLLNMPLASANSIRDLKKRDADRAHCTDETFMQSNRCVSKCDPGFFAEMSTRMCRPCVAPCRTCESSANRCTSCEEPLFLQDTMCVPSCTGHKLSKGPARSRLRLQGGSSIFEGRVEILHEGIWGSICDDEWSIEDAQVVCRELQLGTALKAVNVDAAGFEPASPRMPIHIDDINCYGGESRVEFCSSREWGQHNCAHFEDAGVQCSGPDVSRLCVDTCGHGYYRVPNTNQCELCSEECRSCLGSSDNCQSCEHPRFLHNGQCVTNCGTSRYGHTWNRICERCHENCLNCEDGERNDVCTSCHDSMFLQDGKCVGSCDPKLAKNLAVRLADGLSVYEGRVEVFINGEWGTVCDDQWDMNDAEIVCQQLGYGHALAAIKAPAFGAGTGNVLLDEVDCDGNEAELINCRQRPWGQNDCNHHEDAGVRCQGTKSMGDTGKCVDECGTGYYLQDSYNCMTCAAQCLDCGNGRDQCTACKPPYFLQGNQCVDKCSIHEFGNTITRRCEPCDKNQCARCADAEANNNCTQCETGLHLKNSACVSQCGPDMYLLDDTCKPECGSGLYGNPSSFVCERCPSMCNGCAYDESSTLVCTSCLAPMIFSNGQCVNSCPAGSYSTLMGTDKLPTSAGLRLIGGHDQLEGRLEINYADQWGTVCNDFWDIDAAHIACKELSLGNAVSILNLDVDRNIQPGAGLIWLDNVICLGSEDSIRDCYHQEWGQQDHCNHQKDVAIRCSGPGIRECVATCPSGQYADSLSQSCRSCQANCLQCSNTNNQYSCSQCAPGTQLKGANCVNSCGQGFFHNQETQECLPCSDRCTTCVDQANRCTSCTAEYFLQGMDCVTQCEDFKLLTTDKVRLIPGPLDGRVEVEYQGSYGTVCDDQWGLEDAEVVCQMLGLGHALEAIPEGRAGSGFGDIVLDELNCVGNETSLLSCPHAGLGTNDCQHEEDAGVRCSGPMTSNLCISRDVCTGAGYFAAADGVSCGKCSFNCQTCTGSAEFCTGCFANQFLSNNTCVDNCKEGYYGDANGRCAACSSPCQDCVDSPSYCTGCPVGTYLDNATHTCVASCEDKYLMSGGGSIRLAGSEEPFKGRVEIFIDGQWGTICDDNWDIKDAEVACRELGMGAAKNSFTNGHYGPGIGPIWMDDSECTGDERLLMQCRQHRLGPGNSDCTHQEDAAVECSGPDSSLMCVDECGEGFFPSENRCVHCAANCLSCETSSTQCGSCRAPNFLNSTNCSPQCQVGFYGNTNSRRCEPCNGKCMECFDGPSDDMCKTCMPGFSLEGGRCVLSCSVGTVLDHLLPAAPSTKQVRLSGGGSNSNEGRVEVFHENKWGAVCMNGWDLADAEIVCQELGLGHATSIPRAYRYDQSDMETPIWMNNVNCVGWENSIVQCQHSGWGESNCDPRHTQDAAVQCDGSSYKRPGQNICREQRVEPCKSDSCFSRVTCVDLPDDRSVCMDCPEGMMGDGKNCISISTEPPKFRSTPENRTSRLGYAASLSCRPDGDSPQPITQENWLKNGQPLSSIDLNSQRIRVLSYGNLHFARTRREDTGVYSCVLKNTMGTVKASAHLTVNEAPQILMIRPGVVAEGDTAELACLVGGLPISNISWHFNGEKVTGDRYSSFNINGSLRIQNVTSADQGRYQCIAENALGIDHTMVTLTVNKPPVFVATPKNTTATEGAHVQLMCQAEGKPKPAILWKKDGDDLPHIQNNKYSQDPSGALRINDIHRDDMGVYACIAVNSVQPTTTFVTVLVYGIPHVLKAPANETLSTGETVIIPCEVMGAPAPKVTWEKDGLPIEEGGRYIFQSNGLLINGTNAGDSGTYTCIAVNDEGRVENSAQLQVSGKIIYGTQKHVGLIAGMFFMILSVILIALAIYFFVRRRRERTDFSHKKFGDDDIVKKSPTKGRTLTFDPPVMFSGGNYVKIDKQKGKNKDMEGILDQSAYELPELNDDQL